MPTLNELDLLPYFSDVTLQRGRAYYFNGRATVKHRFQEDDAYVVRGTVSGQSASHYQTTALVQMDSRQILNVDGYCSCPVGSDCKHAVALLWSLIDEGVDLARPVRDDLEIPTWLARLEAVREPTVTPYSDPEYPLYCLVPTGHHVLVELRRARWLKKQQWAKGTRLGLHQLPQWTDRLVRDEADTIALPLLNALPEVYHQGVPTASLEGPEGVFWLREALKTGRVMIDSNRAQPVQPGRERSLTTEWVEQPEGGWTLTQKLADAEESLVLPTEPPWYLASDPFETGPIDTPFSASELLVLSHAPTIPESKAEETFERLASRFKDRLPVPRVGDSIRLDRLEYGRLLLTRHGTADLLRARGLTTDWLAGGDFSDPERPRIIVQFCYDGHEYLLDWLDSRSMDVVRFEEGGQSYSLVRDVDTEDEWIGELIEAGLMEDEVLSGEYFQDDWEDDRPEPLYWHLFIESHLPRLRELGWQVTFLDDWDTGVELVDDWRGEILEHDNGDLDLDLYLEHKGQRIPLVPALIAWFDNPLRGEDDQLLVELDDNQYARIDRASVQPVLDTLTDLLNRDVVPGDTLRLPPTDVGHLANLDQHGLFTGGEAARERARRLTQLDRIEPVRPPGSLKAELRPYQQLGLNWLQFLREFGFGGILADDMGLGKTIQTLAHLLLEKDAGRLDRPALIIAPTSLLGNWHSEAARFTPNLRCLVHHGNDRAQNADAWRDADLVITSYALAWRDEALLNEQTWSFVILDEAQAIKNPRTKMAKAIYSLKASHRLCLTGTPLENHLGDIWALMRFLMPGFLGSWQHFNEHYRKPIERQRDPDRFNALITRLSPFLLRRTKDIVARELPAKTEITQTVALEGPQRALYDSIRATMEKRVKDLLKKKGLANSQIEILDALLKLRQACCDPALVKIDAAKNVEVSAKLDWLIPTLTEMVEEGRKVLVFSSFSSMLARIGQALDDADIGYSTLTGQTRKRDQAIAAFQDGDAPVFLISLKAGGVGLNLTAADTVIHFDPWWNPQAESQATDRAYRIGQDKPVFVYKLVAENTVEDRILTMQHHKKAMADRLLAGGGDGARLEKEALLGLFEA